MEITQCVIDVELFLKVSSDAKYLTLKELLDNNKEFKQGDKDECYCFYYLLSAILEGKKCKVFSNNDIHLEHISIVKKCPTDIFIKFNLIIAQKELFEIRDRKLSHILKKLFKNTPLESKIAYIDVAHQLDQKFIVSTKKHNEKYREQCSEPLLRVQVCCMDVCSLAPKKEV